MSSPVVIEGNLYIIFGTTKVDTGSATDADSLPSAVILDNGVAMVYAPVVAKITTGLYKATLACTAINGFTAGHRYAVYATATVNLITGSDMIDEFEVLAVDLNISGDAPISGVAGAVVAGLPNLAQTVAAIVGDPAIASLPTAAQIIAEINARVIDGSITAIMFERILLAFAAGDRQGLGTALEQYMRQNGTTTAIAFTPTDTKGNGTAVLNGS